MRKNLTLITCVVVSGPAALLAYPIHIHCINKHKVTLNQSPIIIWVLHMSVTTKNVSRWRRYWVSERESWARYRGLKEANGNSKKMSFLEGWLEILKHRLLKIKQLPTSGDFPSSYWSGTHYVLPLRDLVACPTHSHVLVCAPNHFNLKWSWWRWLWHDQETRKLMYLCFWANPFCEGSISKAYVTYSLQLDHILSQRNEVEHWPKRL